MIKLPECAMKFICARFKLTAESCKTCLPGENGYVIPGPNPFDALAAAVADAGLHFTLYSPGAIAVIESNDRDDDRQWAANRATPTLALLAAIRAYNEREHHGNR